MYVFFFNAYCHILVYANNADTNHNCLAEASLQVAVTFFPVGTVNVKSITYVDRCY